MSSEILVEILKYGKWSGPGWTAGRKASDYPEGQYKLNLDDYKLDGIDAYDNYVAKAHDLNEVNAETALRDALENLNLIDNSTTPISENEKIYNNKLMYGAAVGEGFRGVSYSHYLNQLNQSGASPAQKEEFAQAMVNYLTHVQISNAQWAIDSLSNGVDVVKNGTDALRMGLQLGGGAHIFLAESQQIESTIQQIAADFGPSVIDQAEIEIYLGEKFINPSRSFKPNTPEDEKYFKAVDGVGYKGVLSQEALIGMTLQDLVALSADLREAMRAQDIDFQIKLDQAIGNGGYSNPQDLRDAIGEVNFTPSHDCFAAGTQISLWDGGAKPVEGITPEDIVLSYDDDGILTPGRVVQVFRTEVPHLLDFHGTGVTPGHAMLCADGALVGQHRQLIEILVADGSLVRADGSRFRASTGADLGTAEDQLVLAEVQCAGHVERGWIRFGTRFITDYGDDVSVADNIRVGGGVLTDEGLIRWPNGTTGALNWTYSDHLPKPEDYVLQRSGLTLAEILSAEPKGGRAVARQFAGAETVHFRPFDPIGTENGNPGWTVYNFEVAKTHTYVADGIRVHNDSEPATEVIAADGTVVPTPEPDPLDDVLAADGVVPNNADPIINYGAVTEVTQSGVGITTATNMFGEKDYGYRMVVYPDGHVEFKASAGHVAGSPELRGAGYDGAVHRVHMPNGSSRETVARADGVQTTWRGSDGEVEQTTVKLPDGSYKVTDADGDEEIMSPEEYYNYRVDSWDYGLDHEAANMDVALDIMAEVDALGVAAQAIADAEAPSLVDAVAELINHMAEQGVTDAAPDNDSVGDEGEEAGEQQGPPKDWNGNDVGQACFPAGVLVAMADGTFKPVEEVAEADRVMAFTGADDELKPAPVVQTFVHHDRELFRITLQNGDTIDATGEHPFLTENGGFVPVSDLRADMVLVEADGNRIAVKSVEATGTRATVYNFEVEELHTYVAGGLRVHNKANDYPPIVLDLDGDGTELVNLKDSTVFFDVDDDGFLEQTGWAAPDDGILAIDLNGNGLIDEAQEFVFTIHAPEAGSDLPALQAAFDSNDDGILDASDREWSKFRVWRDLNQDGISDNGEVATLAHWGIVSLSLDGIPVFDDEDVRGLDENIVYNTSFFTKADTNIASLVDVGFKFSSFGYSFTEADGTGTATGAVILHGENDQDILKITESDDETIDLTGSNLVGVFGADGFDRVDGTFATQGLILDGAGSADILEGSRFGDWVSGGAGHDILRGGHGNDVLFFDADDLEVNGGSGYDYAIATGDQGVDLDLRFTEVEAAYGTGFGDSLDGTGVTEKVALFGGDGDDSLTGGDGDDQLTGGIGADTLSGGDGDDTLFVGHGDQIAGGAGRDVLRWIETDAVSFNGHQMGVEEIHTGDGSDSLSSGGDHDAGLYGAAGDDTLTGGAGSDILEGGDGNDLLFGDDPVAGANTAGDGGTDQAVYNGLFKWYQINDLGDGRIEVVDNRPEFWGDEGRDTLEGIDQLKFLDRTIHLDGTNNAPINDLWAWAHTTLDTPLTITATELTAQTSDFDGSGVSIGKVGDAKHGVAQKNGAGNIVFTPDTDFVGRASFDYELIDPDGGLRVETAHIFVDGAPVTDPGYQLQWHHDAIDVQSVWTEYTGEGVLIGIQDQGVDYTHVDIDDNYRTDLDKDFRYYDSDAMPTQAQEGHGTTLAGIIAAERNGEGVLGVAYDAEIAGIRGNIRGTGGPGMSYHQVKQSYIYHANFDVVNNSWGITTPYSKNFAYDPSANNYAASWKHSALHGRDGLGTVQVHSAGNGAYIGRNTNDDNFSASRFSLAVGGVDQDLEESSFSAPGAAMLVTAPGRYLLTTDAQSPYGYVDHDYVNLSGTSASAPVVTGIVALMLQANPELGYRDVKTILAKTARKNDPDHDGWHDNGAATSNGGGMHFNHEYGFGLVDAHAAVRVAETWEQQNTFNNEVSIASGIQPSNLAIPDGGVLEASVSMTSDISIEHVEVILNINHGRIGDLIVTLISPDGTESVLANRPGKNPIDDGDRGNSATSLKYLKTSVAHWGENGTGEWTLRVEDAFGGDATGTLNHWTLTLYGAPETDDDVYIFTDDYAKFTAREDADRRTLVDDDNGIDAINAAGTREDQFIDLKAGGTSLIAGNTLTLDQNSKIEKAFAGDGHDKLVGNQLDNLLNGGRGDDTLISGDGGDNTLVGGQGDDLFLASAGRDLINGGEGYDIVDYSGLSDGVTIGAAGIAGNKGRGDVFENVEAIRLTGFSDHLVEDITDLSAQEITGGAGDDTIGGGAGADTLAGQAGDDQLNGGADDDVYLFTSGQDVIAEVALSEVITTFEEAYTEYQTTQTWVDQGEGNGYWVTNQTPVTMYRTVENREIAEIDGGRDMVLFGDGVTITDLLLQQSGSDLILALKSGDTTFADLPDRVTISDWLNTDRRVEEIGFANGTRLDLVSVVQTFVNGSSDAIDLAVAMDQLFEPEVEGDVIVGTGTDDSIMGSDGSDGIAGGDGNDTLGAGDGDDIIFGGDGDDLIDGGQGSDTIDGGSGNDTISYLSSDIPGVTVHLIGDDGYGYSIEGDGSQDQLTNIENVIGSNGADSIVGSDGDNELSGAGGDDTISGEGGNDTLNGDAGDDSLNGGAGADELNGGDGNDTADYQGSDSGVNVDLGAGTGSGGDAEGDTLTGIENVTGSDGDDTLTGDGGDNQLDGQGGHDLIISTSGNDTLIGGQGADYLGGGAGDDVYRFSEGVETILDEVTVSEVRTEEETYTAYRTELVWNDAGESYESVQVAYQATRTTEYTVEVGGDGGQDTLELGPGITADDLVKQLVSRTVQTSDGDIQVRDLVIGLKDPAQPDAAASELSNRITLSRWTEPEYRIEYIKFADGTRQQLDIPASAWGTEGDDEIALAPGAGVLHTHGGDDIVRGSTGDDVIFGDAGNDTIQGDAGNDLLNGGTGADFINGGAGDDTVSYDGASSAVTVNLQSLTASGGDAEGDLLVSVEHAQGSAHDDQLIAAQSGSHLVGGAGADTLTGNDGADTLAGGDDDDLLTGGLGSDVYVFDGGIDRALDEALVTETRSVEETYTAYQTTNTWIDTGEGGGYWQTTSTPYQATRMVDVDVDVAVDAGVDTLRLGGDILPSDLVFELVSHPLQTADGEITAQDLVVALRDPAQPDAAASTLADRIVLENWSVDEYRIEKLMFADGQAMDIGALITTGVTTGADNVSVTTSAIVQASGGDDTVQGSTSDDQLFGGTGDDQLHGAAGIDILAGGGGADQLDGGAGNDYINGGSGNDTLTGGSGNDRFIFDADVQATDVDEITDFTLSQDLIQLDDGLSIAAFDDLADGSGTVLDLDNGAKIHLLGITGLTGVDQLGL